MSLPWAGQIFVRHVADVAALLRLQRLVVYGVRTDVYQGTLSVKCYGAAAFLPIAGKDVGEEVPEGVRSSATVNFASHFALLCYMRPVAYIGVHFRA